MIEAASVYRQCDLPQAIIYALKGRSPKRQYIKCICKGRGRSLTRAEHPVSEQKRPAGENCPVSE